jgi:hypothetical protein
MSTLTVSLRPNAEQQTKARLRLGGESISFSGRRPPLFVPRGQLYYWTREWQLGEAEAMREIENGETQTFANGTSAAKWLLDDEDDADA